MIPETTVAKENLYHELARDWEFYARCDKRGLDKIAVGQKAFWEQGSMVHDQFRAFVMSPHYPCVGARSAFSQYGYRFGFFEPMGTVQATIGLHASLIRFVQEQQSIDSKFSTFIAVFAGPIPSDEFAFEKQLWQQLQLLAHVDAKQYDYDPTVSTDPADPKFAFSVGGRAYFVVGMNPVSSRRARSFGWPAMAFNAHYLFRDLRESGQYSRFQEIIREKDKLLQRGDINPNLSEFGVKSEARQYSGRPVEDDWKCPFLTAHSSTAAAIDRATDS